MAKATKRTSKNKRASERASNVLNEPQAVYERKTSRRSATKGSKPPPLDAKRQGGILPDLAERYVDLLRDEARQTMDKADHLAKSMLRRTKRGKSGKGRARVPGIIDVDRFSGALPHLKGDAVRIQRAMRDEG